MAPLRNTISIFVRDADRLLNVSQAGQVALKGVLDASLSRIEWQSGLAARLYPWVRSGQDLMSQPRTIVIDPRFGFGQPVITSTGIEARIVAQRYRAGESVLALANDYGVEVSSVEDAIRCETREAA